MYLRQTNKWKEFALQEGIEDIGLPPEVANYLRRQNQTFGPVSNKHLTWIGTLIKEVQSSSFFDAGIYHLSLNPLLHGLHPLSSNMPLNLRQNMKWYLHGLILVQA